MPRMSKSPSERRCRLNDACPEVLPDAVRLVEKVDGDKQSEKSERSMYEQEGGFLDETALLLGGPAQILMGPLNLYNIYVAVARARNLAGFGALPPIQTPITSI